MSKVKSEEYTIKQAVEECYKVWKQLNNKEMKFEVENTENAILLKNTIVMEQLGYLPLYGCPFCEYEVENQKRKGKEYKHIYRRCQYCPAVELGIVELRDIEMHGCLKGAYARFKGIERNPKPVFDIVKQCKEILEEKARPMPVVTSTQGKTK